MPTTISRSEWRTVGGTIGGSNHSKDDWPVAQMNIQGNGQLIRESTPSSGWTDEQRTAIQDELGRILADPAFKSSKRCQSMLTRLVEFALEGDHEGIKERTLGVEVFGRDPHYDTSADPIVRITANEIRKRLAQWYTEPRVLHPVRIRLVPGTYLPKFDFEVAMAATEAAEEKAGAELQEQLELNAAKARGFGQRIFKWFKVRRRVWLVAGVALLVVLVSVVILMRRNDSKRKAYLIWEPLLHDQTQLTMCAADVNLLDESNAKQIDGYNAIAKVISSREAPPMGASVTMLTNMSMIDAFSANKLGNLIGQYGKQTVLHPSSELTFDYFRHQPVVLIGGYNPWSLILLSKLRYSIRVDPVTQSKWIYDSQKPASREWSVNGPAEHADVDYALLSRFVDPETGQWILSLGGLWPYGTGSALSLLTDAEYAYLLPPAFYGHKNAQVVLKTTVINGNPGPPQVVAVYIW